MHIALPDDQWAEVRDPEDLDDHTRRIVNKAVNVQYDRETQRPIFAASMQDDIYDALLAEVLENWSYPFPLPKADPSSLEKLKIRAARKLREALDPHMKLINGEDAEDPTEGSAT